MRERLLVMVGILRAGRAAEAGGAADQRLVERFPERGRPHEGLVVEACRQERRQQVVHGADVEGERRPAVLARGDQPVVELGGGGARVRLAPRAGAQFDQRVRLLGARREDAARTMILERAPDQLHAVRHQGGRERVAGEALERASVERERERPRAIDQAAAGQPMPAHGVPPASANFTSLISCVRVLRVTTSHLRQPPP